MINERTWYAIKRPSARNIIIFNFRLIVENWVTHRPTAVASCTTAQVAMRCIEFICWTYLQSVCRIAETSFFILLCFVRHFYITFTTTIYTRQNRHFCNTNCALPFYCWRTMPCLTTHLTPVREPWTPFTAIFKNAYAATPTPSQFPLDQTRTFSQFFPSSRQSLLANVSFRTHKEGRWVGWIVGRSTGRCRSGSNWFWSCRKPKNQFYAMSERAVRVKTKSPSCSKGLYV